MRHRVAGRKFNRPTDHRLSMYRNLVTSLLKHEKIVTTEAKAKEIRPMAEKVITLGKDGSVAARRQAIRMMTEPDLARKVFDTLGPRYAARAGGYTRILKLGARKGDGAPMVQLELV